MQRIYQQRQQQEEEEEEQQLEQEDQEQEHKQEQNIVNATYMYEDAGAAIKKTNSFHAMESRSWAPGRLFFLWRGAAPCAPF